MSKFSITTENTIKFLEKSYAYSAHCEHQVQIFYAPADKDNEFMGSLEWENAEEAIVNQIQNLCFGMSEIDFDKTDWNHVAQFYRDKIIYGESIDMKMKS